MPNGRGVMGTVTISITTLTDDVGLDQMELDEVMPAIMERIRAGIPGGHLNACLPDRDDTVQLIWWEYEGPDVDPKVARYARPDLTH